MPLVGIIWSLKYAASEDRTHDLRSAPTAALADELHNVMRYVLVDMNGYPIVDGSDYVRFF